MPYFIRKFYGDGDDDDSTSIAQTNVISFCVIG